LPTCIKVLQFSPISHRPYTHINFCSFVPWHIGLHIHKIPQVYTIDYMHILVHKIFL
jgi:hypothetical protein